jgi:transcriptional regulator with XRE-family HTH domain
MPRNFKELRAKMTPQAQAESARRANEILRSMSLHELRKESRKTQAQMAEGMGLGQGTISKIEQASNISLGTLQSYVEELGGELEVRAKFPSHSVILTVAKEA